jgi:hypothetical protein
MYPAVPRPSMVDWRIDAFEVEIPFTEDTKCAVEI